MLNANISACIPNKRKLLLDGDNTISIPNNVWFLLVWFFYLLFPCMFCSFNYEFNFIATLFEAILCLFPGTFGNSQQSNFQLSTSKHFTLNILLRFFKLFRAHSVNLCCKTHGGWLTVKNFQGDIFLLPLRAEIQQVIFSCYLWDEEDVGLFQLLSLRP